MNISMNVGYKMCNALTAFFVLLIKYFLSCHFNVQRQLEVYFHDKW